MSGIRKSPEVQLTNAERKSMRESEAQEAMSNHDDAEKAYPRKSRALAGGALGTRGDRGADAVSCAMTFQMILP